MEKGQFIRLVLATTATPTKVIAASKQMSLHGSAATEEDTTKDTTGNATEFDVTSLSYDITGMALVLTDDDTLISSANSLNDFITNFGAELYWRIVTVSGTNNRTIGAEICSGKAIITNLQMQGQNRQKAQFSYTLKGVGAIALPTT